MVLESYKEISKNRYRKDFGLYFEDFKPGLIIEHRPGRTITQSDNISLTLLKMKTAQLHFDSHYASKTEWKKPLVDSMITLAIITGMTVNSISNKVVANLEWDKVKLMKPIFEGDAVYAETEVIEKRDSKSRPTQGIATVETRGFKQTGEMFMSFRRSILIYRKGHAPAYDI